MLAHNVAVLLKSSLGTARTLEIDETRENLGTDLPLRGPLRGKARFTRTPSGILTRCRITGVVALECARCLEAFDWPFEVSFEEEFFPSLSISTGTPLPPSEDDALRIDERHVLDLAEITRQYVTTAVPIQPVCRPDCAGLCPGCGTNLNAGRCACTPDPQAKPLALLAGLLDKDEV